MKVLTLCTSGTEDSELVGTISLLKRAGIESVLATPGDNLMIRGSHGTKILCDLLFDEIGNEDLLDFDGLFFPGGGKGSEVMRNSDKVTDLVKRYDGGKKPIFAICGAPSVLGAAGVLDGRKFTCYDGFEAYAPKGIYTALPVQRDENVITGKSVNYVTEFALSIIDFLKGSETVEKVKKAILRN